MAYKIILTLISDYQMKLTICLHHLPCVYVLYTDTLIREMKLEHCHSPFFLSLVATTEMPSR